MDMDCVANNESFADSYVVVNGSSIAFDGGMTKGRTHLISLQKPTKARRKHTSRYEKSKKSTDEIRGTKCE